MTDIQFSSLENAIYAGEFEPGQRLSEAELARRFGISRGPLREALQRLEGRLVTRRARVGVHVIELSSDTLRELFMIREALEGLAARQAAENARKLDIAALRNLLSRHAKDPALKSGVVALWNSNWGFPFRIPFAAMDSYHKRPDARWLDLSELPPAKREATRAGPIGWRPCGRSARVRLASTTHTGSAPRRSTERPPSF